jgi:serine/threonine protein kinase
MRSSAASTSSRLGHYRLEGLLGAGAAAKVYSAIDERTGKRVAVKVLEGRQPLSHRRIGRFWREVSIVERLRHPHIVEALDCGIVDDQPFLVMELVEGETLASLLARRGRLSLDEIACIFLPVCSAIAKVHDMGVVHRDLKPSNIMLTSAPEGQIVPKVVDFGVAFCEEPGEMSLTSSEVILGTVQYLAPEVARGARHATVRSDVYALGVTLFECATGRKPFRGASAYEIMHASVTSRFPRPSSLSPDLPAAFDNLVEAAVCREVEERMDSARSLGGALLAFASPGLRAIWRDEFSRGAQRPGSARIDPGHTLTESFARPALHPAWWWAIVATGMAVAAVSVASTRSLAEPANRGTVRLPQSSEGAPPARPSVLPAEVEHVSLVAEEPPAASAKSSSPLFNKRRGVPHDGPPSLLAALPAPTVPSVIPATASDIGPRLERGANGAPIIQ